LSEKDIKTKPTSSPKTVSKAPKVVVKDKEAITNTVKDAKSVMKDTLVKKAIDSKLGTQQEQTQPPKADTEAAESVENAAYTTTDTAYHKGKSFAENKIKQHREKVKSRENADAQKEPEAPPEDNAPKTADNEPKTADNYNKETTSAESKSTEQGKSNVKTKEEYLKSQKADTSAHGIKTKESYIDGHTSSESRIKGVKSKKESVHTDNAANSAPQNARKEYVKNKLKTKAEYEKMQADEIKADNEVMHTNAPKDKTLQTKGAELSAEQTKGQPNVKTKESYMQSLRTERTELIKSPYRI